MNIIKRFAVIMISAMLLVTTASCSSRQAVGTMRETSGNTLATSGTPMPAGTGESAGGQTVDETVTPADGTAVQKGEKTGLYPAQDNYLVGGKWGYIDNTGKFAIEPQFSQAERFQENGLAVVYRDGKAGIIDNTGKFIAEPVYGYISEYHEGLAIASDEKGSIVLDEKGKQLSDKYGYIGNYKNGYAIYQDKAENGKYIYGYLDLNGKPAIRAAYQYATDFEGDRATVMLSEKQYALIDPSGNTIRTFNYNYVGGAADGILVFCNTDGKYGYMDISGNIVIQPAFRFANSFDGGKASVSIEDASGNCWYGLIDNKGKFVIQPKYSDIRQLGENIIAVGMAADPDFPPSGTRYALADQNGRLLTGFIYYDIKQPFRDGIASVYDGKELYFIDTAGKRIDTLPSVEGSGTLEKTGDLIYAYADQRPCYMNLKGEVVYRPASSIVLDGGITVSENKFKPNRDYIVYYPSFCGMADTKAQESLNKLLRSETEDASAAAIKPEDNLDYSYDGRFSAGLNLKDLLVLEKTGYYYPKGAAHGMPSRQYLHIDLKTGYIYQLKDLFKSNNNYTKVLSNIVGKQMKDKMKADPENYYYWPENYKGIAKDQPFYITGDSLVLYFQPYEIAPYAARFPEFSVKFDDISDILNKDGAFWRSFN